ncbi:MAG: phosphoribosylaminoimidazolesuccinocarboxamide synthase [Bacteroidales bacterium]|nr:phosphoribosylaminoimidazolesuccinocarboxamide synthase [Bacteroidales bacterium]
MAEFCGVNNSKLNYLSSRFAGIHLTVRSNWLRAMGNTEVLTDFESKLNSLVDYQKVHNTLPREVLESVLKGEQVWVASSDVSTIVHTTDGRPIKPRGMSQHRMVEAMQHDDMVFAVGPAGSGKTYIAIALAVKALKSKQVRKIILSRPAVEAGEKLGFLPGDMKEKIDPYLQPLYDALEDMIPGPKLKELLENKTIEIAPLAFMRGRTLSNAFVILDEAQNTTIQQMKMFLTRMGHNAKFIITGDPSQIDLPDKVANGLMQTCSILDGVEGISIIKFSQSDIVRHRLVQRIVNAFEQNENLMNNRNNETGMSKAVTQTDFKFPGQKSVFHGKVRDVYNISDKYLAMVVTDRISAFDVVLPKGIPFKGQVLNQIAAKFLDATKDIIPNWKVATPDPMVTVGLKCEPFKVEMVIRGYITGSAWRDYKSGKREICGIKLPEGLRENQKFAEPIITPTTKADAGHDMNISREEIIAQGIVSEADYKQIEDYTRKLFQRGTEIAAKQGLILVDTKYEFGKLGDKIILIDEIHTPDSSRYFYAEGYEERFEKGEAQRQLSKEFVRQWLIENGFQGQAGQKVPEMTDEKVAEITARYIELYENITGEKFVKDESSNIESRIEKNVTDFLKSE